MTSSSTPAVLEGERARQPRSDSLRNRARILEAAEEAFGSEGISVPIDVIAERAGVGVGTVYRHFPTKEALFEAIVHNHFQRLVDGARALKGSGDAARAVFTVLDLIVTTGVAKRDLADALAGAGVDFKETLGDRKQELENAVGDLLAEAQAEGSIRCDVALCDLMGLAVGACMTADRSGENPASAARMLSVLCDGLRTR